MLKSKKMQNNNSDDKKLENAKIGYQVAVSLYSSRVDELWSQFGAIMTANSIIMAAAILSIHEQQTIPVLSIGMPVVGLVLCLFWLVLHIRGVSFARYYLLSARELEEKFLLNPIEIISKGGHFASGKPVNLFIDGKSNPLRMNIIGRVLPVRWVAYAVIIIFAAMYIAILFK